MFHMFFQFRLCRVWFFFVLCFILFIIVNLTHFSGFWSVVSFVERLYMGWVSGTFSHFSFWCCSCFTVLTLCLSMILIHCGGEKVTPCAFSKKLPKSCTRASSRSWELPGNLATEFWHCHTVEGGLWAWGSNEVHMAFPLQSQKTRSRQVWAAPGPP